MEMKFFAEVFDEQVQESLRKQIDRESLSGEAPQRIFYAGENRAARREREQQERRAAKRATV